MLSNKLKETSAKKIDLIYIMQNCIAEVKRDIYYRKFAKKDDFRDKSKDTRKVLANMNGDDLITQDEINDEIQINHFSKVDKKSLINN